MEGEYLKIQGRRYGVNNLQSLPADLNEFKCTSRENSDTIGFYGELNPMSNFYNCEFMVNKVRFHSSEQMIQFNKVKHFGDHVTMSQILYADTPLECKQLSRDIVNFNEDNWRQVAKNMCQEGINEKFRQNPTLSKILIQTGDKKIVECSFDKHWGTGLPLSNRGCLDKRMLANNGGILGEMLETTRMMLRSTSAINPAEPEFMKATASSESTS